MPPFNNILIIFEWRNRIYPFSILLHNLNIGGKIWEEDFSNVSIW